MKAIIKFVILSLSLSLTLTVFSANNIAKVTYKWTDKQGIVQYTERPPSNIAYEKVTVTASGGRDIEQVSEVQATEKSKESQDNSTSDVTQANERNCVVAKQNLKVLKNLSRVRVTDEKGENRILSPEEKDARMVETQKQVDVYCSSS